MVLGKRRACVEDHFPAAIRLQVRAEKFIEPAVVAIEDEDVHRTHFHVRDAATGGMRAMDRYLSQLDAIRRVQDYIVSCAETAGVPVIEGSNPDRATAELLELVLASAELVGSR